MTGVLCGSSLNVNKVHNTQVCDLVSCAVLKLTVSIKLFQESTPSPTSPLLSVIPAGWQRGLAHRMPNFPLAPCKYHKMSTASSARVRFCVRAPHRASSCLSVQTPASLPYLLFVSHVFLSVFSFRCLPFITAWIPKCKMAAERETERMAYIFNGGLLYFNEPPCALPSFGSMRMEDDETDGGEKKYK